MSVDRYTIFINNCYKRIRAEAHNTLDKDPLQYSC